MSRQRATCILIFIAAFAVRISILFAFELHNEPFRAELQNISVSLSTTVVYVNQYAEPTGPTAHCPPVYTLLTASVFYLLGTGEGGELALYIINITFASLLYALLPTLGRAVGLTGPVGVTAGLFGAFVPFHYLNEIRLGHPALTGLALMGLTLLALRAPHFSLESVAWILLGCGATPGASFASGFLWVHVSGLEAKRISESSTAGNGSGRQPYCASLDCTQLLPVGVASGFQE